MLGVDVQEVERIFSVLVKLNCIKWQTHFRVDAPHHQANNVYLLSLPTPPTCINESFALRNSYV